MPARRHLIRTSDDFAWWHFGHGACRPRKRQNRKKSWCHPSAHRFAVCTPQGAVQECHGQTYITTGGCVCSAEGNPFAIWRTIGPVIKLVILSAPLASPFQQLDPGSRCCVAYRIQLAQRVSGVLNGRFCPWTRVNGHTSKITRGANTSLSYIDFHIQKVD